MKLTILQWIDNEPYHKRTIYRYFYFLDDNFVFKNKSFKQEDLDTLLNCSLYVISNNPRIMEEYKREYKIWNFAPGRKDQTIIFEDDLEEVNKLIKEGIVNKRLEQLKEDFV